MIRARLAATTVLLLSLGATLGWGQEPPCKKGLETYLHGLQSKIAGRQVLPDSPEGGLAETLWPDLANPGSTGLSTPLDAATQTRFLENRIQGFTIPLRTPAGAGKEVEAPALFIWRSNDQERFAIGSARSSIPFREITDPEMKSTLRGLARQWKQAQKPEYFPPASVLDLERRIETTRKAFESESLNFVKYQELMANNPKALQSMLKTRVKVVREHYKNMADMLDNLSREQRAYALNFKLLSLEATSQGDEALAKQFQLAGAEHWRRGKAALGESDANRALLRRADVTPEISFAAETSSPAPPPAKAAEEPALDSRKVAAPADPEADRLERRRRGSENPRRPADIRGRPMH